MGEVVVSCNGATPTPAGQSIPRADFTVYVSPGFASSRLLQDDWSEAMLIMDGPDAAHLRMCGEAGTVQVSPGVCDIKGTGTGVGVYDGSTERPNVFQGRIAPPVLDGSGPTFNNKITFYGVPIDGGSHFFRIMNMRTAGPPVSSSVVPAQVFAFLTAQSPVTMMFSAQMVGYSVQSLPAEVLTPATFQSCVSQNTSLATDPAAAGISQFKFRFREGMPPIAFKRRSAAVFVDANTSPEPVSQYSYSSVPMNETGFFQPTFPVLAGRGDLGQAGLADFGTRVYARFVGVPSGVRLFAPTTVTFPTGVARMVAEQNEFRGSPFNPVAGNAAGIAEIPVDPVSGAVVQYEILNADPDWLPPTAPEEFEVPIYVAYLAGVPAASVNVVLGFAPVSDMDGADAFNPVPRFKQVWNPVPAFTIEACAACAENVSGRVAFTRSGLRLNRTTNRFMQTITIQNTSAAPISGPLALALDSLSANATVYSPAGATQCATPVSPYVNVNAGADNALTPGESVIVGVEFLNPTMRGITYTTRVLAGSQR